MDHVLLIGAVLAAGTALALLAQWRGWRPRLGVALAAGTALRAAVWGMAAAGVPQTWDFTNDFPAAAAAVLQHHDPVLSNPGRWHILPLVPFVLAAELKAGQVAHVAWPLIGKLAPVAADLVLIPLVGRLAGRRGPLSAFQYACNPISIMVCALHGQIEPVSLALGIGAFLVARSGRPTVAGLLCGLSAATGGWPILLLPGILLALPPSERPAKGASQGAQATEERAGPVSRNSPGNCLADAFRTPWGRQWRPRVAAAVCAAVVPALLLVSSPLTVGTPIRELPHLARLLIGARSIVGDWGWTAVATGGLEHAESSLARPGKLVLIAALAAVAYLWRRADPLHLTAALLIAFLVATPRLGVQYLMFPVPFLLARAGRAATPAMLASAAWAAVGYLYVSGVHAPGWYTVHRWWALSSLAVIGCLIAAMPWAERDRQRTDTGATSSDSPLRPSPARSSGTADGAVPALPADG